MLPPPATDPPLARSRPQSSPADAPWQRTTAGVLARGPPICHTRDQTRQHIDGRGQVVLANIPAAQTVIEIKQPGGPEMLVPAIRPVPEPKSGEVLIRIASAGVNRADCLQRMGRYPMPPGAPDIPGLECSGTVLKCGDDVGPWKEGDRVCALMVGDGYGEYASVPAVQCLPVPRGISLIDAGGLVETFCTVWTNVFERMQLRPGETFLVQGGSSGT